MNNTFAEHVTNTAFFLSISKKQIRYLEILYKTPYPNPRYYVRTCFSGGRDDPDNWIASYSALLRKGLVERIITEPERNEGYYSLTEAGRLTCLLLIEAGLMSSQELATKAA